MLLGPGKSKKVWSSRPIEITLSNGVLLVPTQDDEGNNGGSIATNITELPTIPTT